MQWHMRLYPPGQLEVLCDCLSAEHWLKQGFRSVALATLISILVLTLCCLSPWGVLIYFTNWNLLVTIYSLWATIRAVEMAKFQGLTASALAEHHLCFCCSLFFNLVTLLGYWPMHSYTMKYFRGQPVQQLQQVLIHSLPPLLCLAHYSMTKTRLCRSLDRVLVGVGCVYMMVNWSATKAQGQPLYPFLTFRDSYSYCLALAMLLAIAPSYHLLCSLDSKLRPIKF